MADIGMIQQILKGQCQPQDMGVLPPDFFLKEVIDRD